MRAVSVSATRRAIGPSAIVEQAWGYTDAIARAEAHLC
jgi:hypothetical protein